MFNIQKSCLALTNFIKHLLNSKQIFTDKIVIWTKRASYKFSVTELNEKKNKSFDMKLCCFVYGFFKQSAFKRNWIG